MKFIRTQLHGLLDYGTAFILILPWIANFYAKNENTWIIAVVGLFVLLLSLFTDYEFGLIKIIPMKIHLFLDVLTSVFLMVLPFIFRLYDYYFIWPIIIGFGMLLLAIFSSSKPYVISEKDLNITKPY